MFQKSADKRFHPNVVGSPRDVCRAAANSAYHDVDLHAGATGRVESVDDLRIDEGIAFYPDLRGLTASRVIDFVGNVAQQRLLESDWRNRPARFRRLGIAGDEIENARDVSSDRRVGGE